jgi:hypothetical protein
VVTKTKWRSELTLTRKLVANTRLGLQGAILSTATYTYPQLSIQKTVSQGNSWPPKKGQKNLDAGGEFLSQKQELVDRYVYINAGEKPSGSTWQTAQGQWGAFQGAFGPTKENFVDPSAPAVLDALGTNAIAGCIPTNPLSGMGQFLGELRDLPKVPAIQLWKQRARYFKSLARNGSSEYLNVQFGWVPFIKDIRSFALTVKDKEKHIAQYDRDSGRHVRRRRGCPSEKTSTTTNLGTNYGSPPLHLDLFSVPGTLLRTTATVRRRWFVGAFTYYLTPSGLGKWSEAKRAEQLANHLYGLRITPDLLWKLAPWSWAADWVGNIGNVIHNWSAFQNDGLVMHYGYVMEETTRITDYALVGALVKGVPPCTPTQTFITTTKYRRRATPYGFGLNAQAFTAKQWSIIAALGISRAPRSLNF